LRDLEAERASRPEADYNREKAVLDNTLLFYKNKMINSNLRLAPGPVPAGPYRRRQYRPYRSCGAF